MRLRFEIADWTPLAWSLGAVAAAFLPWVPIPSLGVLRGPLGLALVALGVGVSASRAANGLGSRWRAPSPRALFALTLVASAVTGVHYVQHLSASGDEPHYLLMAQSLWREHDLDLRDNIARGDYREYFPGSLEPHWGAPAADGRPYPAHSPGLPALLAPVYALGGRRACVLLFAFLLAALGHETASLARRLTNDAGAGLLAWAAAVGPPAFAYSFHLYTELPSALAIAFALRVLLAGPTATPAALAALAASTLPWLHLKMIPAAAALGLLAILRLRGRARLVFVGVSVVCGALFLAHYQRTFGTPTPLALYGGGVPPASGTSALRAAAGLLLDRSFGLLPFAPVLLLALAGIPYALRWPRQDALAFFAVAAAILAPLLDWRMWWGGQCPPGRFLVPLVPLLAVLVAARRGGGERGLLRWRGALLAAGASLTLYMAANPEARLMLNRGDRPTRVWAALSGDTPLGRYLPSLVSDTAADRRVAALWAGAIAILLALDVLARRSDRADRLFRGLALPVLLSLGVCAVVDAWARGPEPAPTPRPSVVSSRRAAASGTRPS